MGSLSPVFVSVPVLGSLSTLALPIARAWASKIVGPEQFGKIKHCFMFTMLHVILFVLYQKYLLAMSRTIGPHMMSKSCPLAVARNQIIACRHNVQIGWVIMLGFIFLYIIRSRHWLAIPGSANWEFHDVNLVVIDDTGSCPQPHDTVGIVMTCNHVLPY